MAESQARRIRSYVQGLERVDRYIVLLYYADGLTPMEISRVLDLPSMQVRSRLEELRTHLSGLTGKPTKARATEQPPAGPTVTAFA